MKVWKRLAEKIVIPILTHLAIVILWMSLKKEKACFWSLNLKNNQLTKVWTFLEVLTKLRFKNKKIKLQLCTRHTNTVKTSTSITVSSRMLNLLSGRRVS
jgi:hypothetical protein